MIQRETFSAWSTPADIQGERQAAGVRDGLSAGPAIELWHHWYLVGWYSAFVGASFEELGEVAAVKRHSHNR